MKFLLCQVIFSLCLFVAAAAPTSQTLASDVKTWCTRTPHPKPCEYFMIQGSKRGLTMEKEDFLGATVRLSLDHAMQARAKIYTLGFKFKTPRERSAWLACLELYDDTVRKLNATADPTANHEWADAQTWLSAAMTNLETCKTGFVELGADSNYILPMLSNNVSSLISNSLAINSKEHDDIPRYKDGFPRWVLAGDRRLLHNRGLGFKPHAVVARDGSGNYTTVGEALIKASTQSGIPRYVIYVKAGVYTENIRIDFGLKNIMLVGDGMGKTIITGSKSFGGGLATFHTSTVFVNGDGFMARGITFQNTAGPQNHQAVAILVNSDCAVFYQCSFDGYQDTLYVHSQRQFYRECNIYGTVDFIFGNGAAVFQNCNIIARNSPTKTNIITAQGRTNPNQTTGISIHNCRVMAGSDLVPVQGSVRTFLGRPWQPYSRTVFLKTFLDNLIDPAGWLPWSGDVGLNTLYYGEYLNTGPGSSTGGRVKWKGYHVITSVEQASEFTVARFVSGNTWLPATNVPFSPDL